MRALAQTRCRRWCAASGRAASRAWRRCLPERRPRRCPRAPPRTPRAARPVSARRLALPAALRKAPQTAGPMRASSACASAGRTRRACGPAPGQARRAAALRALLTRSSAVTPCARGLARRLLAAAGARRRRARGPAPALEALAPRAATQTRLAGAARRGAAARLSRRWWTGAPASARFASRLVCAMTRFCPCQLPRSQGLPRLPVAPEHKRRLQARVPGVVQPVLVSLTAYDTVPCGQQGRA